MPQLGARISDSLDAELTTRGDRSTVARETLERYFKLLQNARRTLRAGLTPDEQAAIVSGFSSTPVDDQMRYGRYVQGEVSGPMLVAHLDDCIRFETVTFEQFDFQPAALLNKLRVLDDLHIVALLDAVERFWAMIAAGGQRDPKRMLD